MSKALNILAIIVLAIFFANFNYVDDGRNMICVKMGGEFVHCLEFLHVKLESKETPHE